MAKTQSRGCKMKRRIHLCTECLYKAHEVTFPDPINGWAHPGFMYVDGKKWVCYHRSPSRAVKCSECGAKIRHSWEPAE